MDPHGARGWHAQKSHRRRREKRTSPQAPVRVPRVVALGVIVASNVVDGAGRGTREGKAQTTEEEKHTVMGGSRGRESCKQHVTEIGKHKWRMSSTWKRGKADGSALQGQ